MIRMLQIQFITSGIALLCCSMSAIAVAELPDPTRPAYWSQKSAPVFVEQTPQPGKKIEWRVTAIRIAPDDRTAIVNGKLVRTGDSVNTAIVREIKHSAVVIEDDQKQLILRLLSSQTMKNISKQEKSDFKQ